jgi:hypothetical protein
MNSSRVCLAFQVVQQSLKRDTSATGDQGSAENVEVFHNHLFDFGEAMPQRLGFARRRAYARQNG